MTPEELLTLECDDIVTEKSGGQFRCLGWIGNTRQAVAPHFARLVIDTRRLEDYTVRSVATERRLAAEDEIERKREEKFRWRLVWLGTVAGDTPEEIAKVVGKPAKWVKKTFEAADLHILKGPPFEPVEETREAARARIQRVLKRVRSEVRADLARKARVRAKEAWLMDSLSSAFPNESGGTRIWATAVEWFSPVDVVRYPLPGRRGEERFLFTIPKVKRSRIVAAVRVEPEKGITISACVMDEQWSLIHPSATVFYRLRGRDPDQKISPAGFVGPSGLRPFEFKYVLQLAERQG